MLFTVLGAVIPWLLVGVGAWLLFELVRLSGRVLLRLDALDQRLETLANRPVPAAPAQPSKPAPPPGLPLGSPAPAFELPDLAGNQHSLAEFKGRPLLLIFFNPQCGFCTRMADALAKFGPEGGEGRPMPLVVSTGSADDNRAMVEKYGLQCRLLLQPQTEVSSRYQAGGTPMGYLINAEGNIDSPLFTGADPILALASGQAPAAAQTQSAPPPDLPLGSAAPEFELPDLAGNLHSLAEFKGRRLVLIFFSPRCGYCTAMADALAKLPQEGDDNFAMPVLVSTGSVDDNTSMVDEYGLRCLIVLQQQMEVASRYHCAGTPMGYLIDEQGNIASPKSVGANPLLALCQPPMAAAAATNGQTAGAAGNVAAAAGAAAAGNSTNGSHQPCGKCKDGKTPCGKCADKIAAANGHAAPAAARGQPYDLVDLRAHGSADAMADELFQRSEDSVRLVVLHGGSGADTMSGVEAASLRRFLRQHSDWLVSYQPENASRFIVLSRDPGDRKALPSLLTKAANFAKALSLHIADGASKVTAEQMERRLEICTLCDRRAGDHCSACGCDLPTKAGWRTTLCPLGKWPGLDKAQGSAAPVDAPSVGMSMAGAEPPGAANGID